MFSTAAKKFGVSILSLCCFCGLSSSAIHALQADARQKQASQAKDESPELDKLLGQLEKTQENVGKEVEDKLQRQGKEVNRQVFVAEFQVAMKKAFEEESKLIQKFEKTSDQWLSKFIDDDSLLAKLIDEDDQKFVRSLEQKHGEHAFGAFSKVSELISKLDNATKDTPEKTQLRAEFLRHANEWLKTEAQFRGVRMDTILKNKCESANTLLRIIAYLFIAESKSMAPDVLRKKLTPIAIEIEKQINSGGKSDSEGSLAGAMESVRKLRKSTATVNVAISAAKTPATRISKIVGGNADIKRLFKINLALDSIDRQEAMVRSLDKKLAIQLEDSLKTGTRLRRMIQLKLFIAGAKSNKEIAELLSYIKELRTNVDGMYFHLLPSQAKHGDPLAIRSRLDFAAKCLELAGDAKTAKSVKQLISK